MDHEVVLVDDNNMVLGVAEKLPAHHADTPLHRGFSCYVFNEKGEVLVTRRALVKKVWPGVWTNTVCGHPQQGETTQQAIERRLKYELGMSATDYQEVLPDYRYKTPPFQGIIENELCPVFIARATSSPKPNPSEVEEFRWMTWTDFIAEASADHANILSYWCKDQLTVLAKDKKVLAYTA